MQILVKLFFIFFFIVFLLYMLDPVDTCLDTGYCKAGLKLRIDAKKEIIINKQTCLENNGIWLENKQVCHFKD